MPITDAWFVREGVCSMIATEREGGDIEVGTIGRERLVGLPVLLGAESTPNRVLVQVEGDAWRMPADAFRRVLDERAPVRRLCLRYAQYFADQLAQAVACNRLHTLEERCAPWLLMTHDRVSRDEFELTHGFLDVVTVLDRAQLENVACACYGITRAPDSIGSSASGLLARHRPPKRA